VGTSNRHGATSITQFELLEKPPASRSENNPWPQWPIILRTSSSHEEGADRKWSILTKEFIGDENGNLKGLLVANIQWVLGPDGKMKFEEIFGSEREIPCDLALLAVGFLHGEFEGFQNGFGIGLDKRQLPKNHHYQTQNEKVFVAGDMRRGQSLVVWAISEGREAAYHVDSFLTGSSLLPRKDQSAGMITSR
jgi:glutamate synthase (NADPH/NADH) small chain